MILAGFGFPLADADVAVAVTAPLIRVADTAAISTLRIILRTIFGRPWNVKLRIIVLIFAEASNPCELFMERKGTVG